MCSYGKMCKALVESEKLVKTKTNVRYLLTFVGMVVVKK